MHVLLLFLRSVSAARRAVPALLFCACIAIAALHAGDARAIGSIRQVDPGEAPRLDAEDALLAIAVDTDVHLEQLRIERIGFTLDAAKFRTPPLGRSMQLYVVPAGRYRWDSARTGNLRYDLADDQELHFDVVAGSINYPGDLVIRAQGPLQARFHRSNRSLLAMDWLDANHPALSKSLPFAFRGHFEDPFPAFYRAAVAAAGSASKASDVPPQAADAAPPASDAQPANLPPSLPESASLPLPIDTLWRPSRLRAADLNPRGDLFADIVLDDSTWGVDIFDLQAGTSTRVLESPLPIREILWSGDRNLVVRVGMDWYGDIFVLKVEDTPQGRRRYLRLQAQRPGHVIGVVPGQPDTILFASVGHLGLHVHRLDISSQDAIDRETFHARNALDRGVKDDVAWFADAGGALRAALVRSGEGLRFLHGRDGVFTPGPLLESLEGFSPLVLSADGARIFGTTSHGREQTELVALDLATGTISETLYKRAGRDVVAAVLGERGELIGASYHEHGHLVSDYFDAADTDLDRRLRAAFPGRSVWLLDRNTSRDQYVLAVEGSDRPGQFFHLDLAARRASLLDEASPWLETYRFAAASVLHVPGAGGVEIEAYLTLPAAASATRRVPLVVMPHGGPIGIRDTRGFDPDVQFLASLGYGVLQVNFRGSAGFGRAFQKAGEGGFGTVIEDDIDTVLQSVLASQPVDGQRMCMFGTSYGGYSALISSVRWPGRFRCVISMSGVSDRLLQFTASDSGATADGRAAMKTIMGDPVADQTHLRTISPLYRVDGLRDPILLVHGSDDVRVDFEHTRRLVRLLTLAGRPPTVLRLDGEGHGIVDPDKREQAWKTVAGFLRTHLDAVPPAAATPAP